ncbi:MAG: ABC transporter permease [Anaerolineae bacterium]|nr:ABC transporter permease [Anaerolineae bacterium]
MQAYGALVYSAFGSVNGFAETMVKACPLLLAGLGVTVAFRARFWNIGAEGQIYAGGIMAAVVGIYITGLPAVVHLPLTVLAGAVGGALWGLVPGYLKARLKVNEVITTLMLNYVIILLAGYLIHGPMRDRASGITISPQLLQTAWLPTVIPRTRFHAGILLALALAVVVYWLLERTVLGFQIRTVGENERAARVAGVRVGRTIILTMIVSGALAGLAGAAEVAGLQHRLVDEFSPGYGFLAVAVALLGNLHPIGVVFASVLFAALLNGADAMQRAASVPVPVIFVIEGLVIVLVSARFFRQRSG